MLIIISISIPLSLPVSLPPCLSLSPPPPPPHPLSLSLAEMSSNWPAASDLDQFKNNKNSRNCGPAKL